MRAKAEYRPATDVEKERVAALVKCSLPPVSMTKRFARDVAFQVANTGEISEKQAAYLAVSAYRFRRQMPAHLVPESPPPGYVTPLMTKDANERIRLAREIEQRKSAP